MTLPYVDFLQLITKFEINKKDSKKYAKIIEYIEKQMTKGNLSVKKDMMPVIKYQPEGSEKELPLYVASSIVSEISPLLLVLKSGINFNAMIIEEPEAHLHVQVQQVFIRKAYDVLTNHKFIKENENFATQLVISTHSSHVARETNFADLRYFKRLSEGSESTIATSKVINLSDVFVKEDETDKFVTRYLQSTHCDLFFADAVILVEGSAENMLLPHFIRNKYPKLYLLNNR